MSCQEYAQRPCCFKVTLWKDTDFNYTLYVVIIYIDGKPILLPLEQDTRF